MPVNCYTAVDYNKGWKDQRINAVYQEMAEHYGTAIIPACIRAPLPATPYELAGWKQATVRFNYHISFAGMLYSVPYEYIKRKVDVRVTNKTIEIFYNHNRIASHRRLYGRKGQYSTVTEHMPESHQQYLEW